MKKTYNELLNIVDFNDRLEYLYIGDKVSQETFGCDRWINQRFYRSQEWKRLRDRIIMRDNGCDLGVDGCGLSSKNIIVHHINPITKDDILERRNVVFDENNLISVSLQSHNYIHYGAKLEELPMERLPNDTCPWKKDRR